MQERFLRTLAAVPILAVCAIGQDAKVDTPTAQLATLMGEYEATELGYADAYAAFRPRFEAFAKEHLGTDSEATATLWLLRNCWWLRSDGTMEETSRPIAESLLERHAKSPQLWAVVEYQYVFGRADREPMFQSLFGVTPHKSVKAWAQLGLARLDPVRGDDGEPNEHFALLMGDYKDCSCRESTMGVMADAYVNPHTSKDLEVGQPAPEIIGLDENGKPMKLSDYRGKVVLLDFWGHW